MKMIEVVRYLYHNPTSCLLKLLTMPSNCRLSFWQLHSHHLSVRDSKKQIKHGTVWPRPKDQPNHQKTPQHRRGTASRLERHSREPVSIFPHDEVKT